MMAPAKRVDLEKLSWAFAKVIEPEQLEDIHMRTAYRMGLKNCKNCKRNCMSNPQCLTGLGEEKYLKSQPAEVASLESSLLELRDPTQYVGLKNLGATCYVNSLIQVWFHNEDMRRIIYMWNIMEDPEERENFVLSMESGQPYHPTTVVGQLQYIFAMMQFGNSSLLDPTNLAIALSLDTRTQQDAHEFSKLLLCHIEGKLQQNSELKGMLQKLSQGKYSYVNCCTTCGTEYSTSTTFYELDLQLAATLKKAIEKYLTEEQLTGPNQYLCTTCNVKQDARRFIRLDSLPDTLNIQLLRFVFNRSGQKRKLNSFIQFPEYLDMSEYLRCPIQTHFYSLVAVLSHKGSSAYSGHYIANICNSNGEWYQFSDDKVERMQNERIEDDLNDTSKSVKRGRVPKGFLSSNTAYMLVYKKTSSPKKGRPKKGKPETDNAAQLENLSGEDLVNTLDNGKRKDLRELEVPLVREPCSSEKIANRDSEKKIATEASGNNKDFVVPVKVKEEIEAIDECVERQMDGGLSVNGNKQPNVEEHVKKLITKNSNVDYRKLNGAAHRAMCCGEHDFYEEMEFENWKVCDTVRELVRQENVKHELSLLAVQQEKQKEVKEQNEKRQLVIDFYNMVVGATTWTEYQWVATDWLSEWLKEASSDGVPPIDNSTLLCPHDRFDPLEVNRAKCLPVEAAELLYQKYRGGPKLDQYSLCETCVKQRCKMIRFKMTLERDYREVGKLVRNAKELSDTDYVVGSKSLKSWRKLAMEKFIDGMENERDNRDQQEYQDESKSVDEESNDGSKEVDECEENEVIINFNEDLLCEHNSLKAPDSSRKIVPREAWLILRTYFPESKEYPVSTSSCPICDEKMESAQKARKENKVTAKRQKNELNDLYYGKNRNKILKGNDPRQLFYIVEKSFLDNWRSFIRYTERFSRTSPLEIQNAVLLCESHKGFLYQPSVCSDLYSIVTAEEWIKLIQFYEVDYEITIKKTDLKFVTNPGLCSACMLARVEQERLKSLKYDKATIYIRCVNDTEDCKSETDSEISAKKPKMDSARLLRTRRIVKDSPELKGSPKFTLKKLKVSSDITLKELKVMTMQLCGAGPYDQHLMLGSHELTDHSQNLASLGIFPETLLTLKIDMPIESVADIESSATNHEAATPEKGFKGTELVPR